MVHRARLFAVVPLGWAVAAVALAIALAGCGLVPRDPSQTLSFENRGGQPYAVSINGVHAIDVACNAGGGLTPGVSGLPQLPWDIAVERGGATIYTAHIDHLPADYVQIGDSVLGVNYTTVLGPAGPTCPPSASEALASPTASISTEYKLD